MSKAESIVGE